MSIYTNAIARNEEVNRLNKNLGVDDKNEWTPSKDYVDSVARSEAEYIVRKAKELGITPFEFIMMPKGEVK